MRLRSDLPYDKASFKASVTACQAVLKDARHNFPKPEPKHAASKGESGPARKKGKASEVRPCQDRMSIAVLSRAGRLIRGAAHARGCECFVTTRERGIHAPLRRTIGFKIVRARVYMCVMRACCACV